MSVVVCAHTERRLAALEAAVSGASAQLGPRDELVVVIDHNQPLLELARRRLLGPIDAAHGAGPAGDGAGASTLPRPADAAEEMSPAHASAGDTAIPALRVIANGFAAGLSGARNTGLANTRGSLVAFLDDDAKPRAGWLAHLTEGFADPDVIGVGGLVAPAWEGTVPRWLPREFLWVVGCSYRGLPTPPAEVRNPIGANMAFRRWPVDLAGGFRDGIGRVERTALGCEETELAIRVRALAGGRIIQAPAAIVDHLVPSERARWRYFVRRCWAEGISKAIVSRAVGKTAALASERRYATRTLPGGVARGLRDALKGDPYGLVRALAIALGLIVTAAGYLQAARSLHKAAGQS